MYSIEGYVDMRTQEIADAARIGIKIVRDLDCKRFGKQGIRPAGKRSYGERTR